MPRKSRLNVELANHQLSEPFLPTVYLEYTPEERGELRKIFESPLWQKHMANVRLYEPTLFVAEADGPLGQAIACNRLHVKQGWALCMTALIKPILPPAPKRKTLAETYPDAGRIDFDPNSIKK